ncbi:phosphatase PAP2 family protein [Parasalinivibrio latis]|uniref:phosphatase PAP2 family protein n=1 Tax=Parasalinivibrio latis TaxID=2952610 RepID=UPI0030E37B26
MPYPNRVLWFKYLIAPVLLFLLFAWIIEHTGLDLKLADFLFHLEGGIKGQGWPLRDAFITKNILHGVGHDLVVVIGVIALVLAGLSWKLPVLKPYRHGLLYIVLCFAMSTLIVGLLKSLTHVNCPWDLTRYGGSQPFVPTFSELPEGVKQGRCFPGGHASGGYGWVCLFFLAKMYRPRLRYVGFAAALVVGLTFDIDQQLRGAHFLSHGYWTLGISWMVAAVLYLGVFRKYAANE